LNPPILSLSTPTSPAKSATSPATSAPSRTYKSLPASPSLVFRTRCALPCFLSSPRRSPLAPPPTAVSGRTPPPLEPLPRREAAVVALAGAVRSSAAAWLPPITPEALFPSLTGVATARPRLGIAGRRRHPRFLHRSPPPPPISAVLSICGFSKTLLWSHQCESKASHALQLIILYPIYKYPAFLLNFVFFYNVMWDGSY
jgi:hypothetical protein